MINNFNVYDRIIVLTHFEPNGHYLGSNLNELETLRHIEDRKIVLCCGHSHKQRIEKDLNFTLYNCGSDYDKPDYIEFDF